jgi:outer membrane receptor protein involved in Fe transport
MNDSFGLNSNGYPTERMPFSYDAINQVSVELAPFDVQYGGFSACNVNAVTKSGGNQYSGSAFYDYTSDSLRGDTLEGDSIVSGAYTEKRYGVTFGGPIIEDKLFFFAAYEKLEGSDLMDRGAIGSGAVNEVLVTQFELDEIERIANQVYLYDPGFIPNAMAHEDEKLLARFDWNINDSQRAAFTYTYNDGFGNTGSDRGQDEIEFSNHYYIRQTELNSYAGALYSDWSDNFSTEFRVSKVIIDANHGPVGGTDFGEIRVELADVDVYLGSDDSRQSNNLDYDTTTVSLKGNYYMDGHALTFGIEREALEVFNLFVQHTETEMRFNSIADFENGIADDIYYNNAPSHNPDEAAAVWGYQLNTLFAQDEMDVSDNLSLVFGLRYDWYTSDDRPGENAEFVSDYGFSNDGTFDGEGLLQPRVGFTWDMSGDTSVHGGVGLYSGGDPNVWLSNAYSGNNILQFGSYARDIDITGFTWVDVEANAPAGAGAGWGVPSFMHDQVTGGTGSNFEMSFVDPNFKLPKEWKFALGVNHTFPGDYVVTADLLLTKGEDSPRIERVDLAPAGFGPDGHPLYDTGYETGILEPAFALTNSAHGTRSTVISLGLAKAIGDNFDYRVGYSYTDAEDSNPMTSSVSFSNYTNRAFFDPQEDVLATSNYAIKNRLVATANWRKEFANNYLLTLSMYGSYNSGRPYTIGVSSAAVHGFDFYLGGGDNLLAPGTERNSETGSSWTKVDFKAKMDFPGFGEEHHASAFIVIDNLTNLLNDDWGVLYQHNFPRTVSEGTAESRLGDASRYEIRFGVEYSF